MKTITDAINQIIKKFEKGENMTVPEIKKLLSRLARQHKLGSIPKLVDLVSAIPQNYKDKLLPMLKTKPVRTASGIAVVAVMCKPHRCPHIATTGNICIYCPGGPDSDFEYST